MHLSIFKFADQRFTEQKCSKTNVLASVIPWWGMEKYKNGEEQTICIRCLNLAPYTRPI